MLLLEEAMLLLEEASKCFGSAGNHELAARAQRHTEAICFRLALGAEAAGPEGGPGRSWQEVAKHIVGFAREGFLDDAHGMCQHVAGMLRDWAPHFRDSVLAPFDALLY
mmetsp:Transcript_18707/g.46010  ORF Transcript_18707/g.46010 Transcript_18707/m.46010 type:complete len:109 (-) Transcript_18707:109-435(-)